MKLFSSGQQWYANCQIHSTFFRLNPRSAMLHMQLTFTFPWHSLSPSFYSTTLHFFLVLHLFLWPLVHSTDIYWVFTMCQALSYTLGIWDRHGSCLHGAYSNHLLDLGHFSFCAHFSFYTLHLPLHDANCNSLYRINTGKLILIYILHGNKVFF